MKSSGSPREDPRRLRHPADGEETAADALRAAAPAFRRVCAYGVPEANHHNCKVAGGVAVDPLWSDYLDLCPFAPTKDYPGGLRGPAPSATIGPHSRIPPFSHCAPAETR